MISPCCEVLYSEHAADNNLCIVRLSSFGSREIADVEQPMLSNPIPRQARGGVDGYDDLKDAPNSNQITSNQYQERDPSLSLYQISGNC